MQKVLGAWSRGNVEEPMLALKLMSRVSGVISPPVGTGRKFTATCPSAAAEKLHIRKNVEFAAVRAWRQYWARANLMRITLSCDRKGEGWGVTAASTLKPQLYDVTYSACCWAVVMTSTAAWWPRADRRRSTSAIGPFLASAYIHSRTVRLAVGLNPTVFGSTPKWLSPVTRVGQFQPHRKHSPYIYY